MARLSFQEDLKAPGPMGYWGAEPVPPREGDVELYDAYIGRERADDRTPHEVMRDTMDRVIQKATADHADELQPNQVPPMQTVM